MAGFLIPFGRTIGEMGAGFAQGEGTALDNRWKDLNNQLLEKQLKMGGMDPKYYLRSYVQDIFKRNKNLQIGQDALKTAETLRTTDPQQAARWQMFGQQLIGDGSGSDEDPTQLGLNLNIRSPDIKGATANLNYLNKLTSPVSPVPVTMRGPNGDLISGWAGLSTITDPVTGEKTASVVPLPDVGGTMGLGVPPGIPSSGAMGGPPPYLGGGLPPGGGSGMAPAAAPPAATGGVPPPTGYPPSTPPGGPVTTPGPVAGSGLVHPSAIAPGSGPSDLYKGTGVGPMGGSTPAAPAGGMLPRASAETGVHPMPVPKVWDHNWAGGAATGTGFLRQKLSPRDNDAVNALAGVAYQTDEFYRLLRNLPPDQRSGSLGAKIHWLALKLGISEGQITDEYLTGMGLSLTALVQGFLGVSQTRAYAAVKLVQDHYPHYGDSTELAIHKLEQLSRPDGYLNFARNAILWGPTTATLMNPIREPKVIPPNDDMIKGSYFKWPNGVVGARYSGDKQIYWQDPDGYWVQKNWKK